MSILYLHNKILYKNKLTYNTISIYVINNRQQNPEMLPIQQCLLDLHFLNILFFKKRALTKC